MTRLEQPLTMNDIASVAISELIRKNVVTSPLARPIRSPAPIPRKIATGALVWSAKWAETTPANP